MSKKRICFVINDDLKRNERVRRQIWMLRRGGYDIFAITPSRPDIQGVKILELPQIRKSLFYGYKNIKERLISWDTYKDFIFELTAIKNFDLFIAHHWQSLPLAFKLREKAGGAIIFDAHDYYPLQFINTWYWRHFRFPLIDRFHRIYLPLLDGMITSSDSFADRFYQDYNIRAEVIRNIPFYHANSFKPTDPNRVRLIHHGYTARHRKLEDLINIMRYLSPQYSLDFMLINTDNNYMDRLKRLAKKIAAERINFKEPVMFEKIIPALTSYDIGICLCPPACFNLKGCLPNKFLQSIMAGNAVVSGVSPEMGKIITQYRCGIYIDNIDCKTVASQLNNLKAEDIDRMKQNSLLAAKELNAENEMQKFMDIVKRLCG